MQQRSQLGPLSGHASSPSLVVRQPADLSSVRLQGPSLNLNPSVDPNSLLAQYPALPPAPARPTWRVPQPSPGPPDVPPSQGLGVQTLAEAFAASRPSSSAAEGIKHEAPLGSLLLRVQTSAPKAPQQEVAAGVQAKQEAGEKLGQPGHPDAATSSGAQSENAAAGKAGAEHSSSMAVGAAQALSKQVCSSSSLQAWLWRDLRRSMIFIWETTDTGVTCVHARYVCSLGHAVCSQLRPATGLLLSYSVPAWLLVAPPNIESAVVCLLTSSSVQAVKSKAGKPSKWSGKPAATSDEGESCSCIAS